VSNSGDLPVNDAAPHVPTFSLELDDGVVVLRWAAGVVITGPRAAEAMAAVDQLNGGRTRPLLVDMTGTNTLTREARETFRGDVLVSVMALVGQSAVDRVIANFGLRVSSLRIPARYFTSVAAGLDWLRQHE
jgi:hypothetical protein